MVCWQDYTRTPEQILVKLGWRIAVCPEKTSSTFGADPQIFFSFNTDIDIDIDKAFLNTLKINSQVINSSILMKEIHDF